MRLPTVLQNRGYRNLFLAQLTSQLGDSVYFLVFLFMAQKISGSATVAGMVGVAQAVPFILLGPAAGVVADRFDRKSVLLACDLCSGLLTLALATFVAVNAHPPVWVIGLAAFSLSSAQAFFFPARSAAIPGLIQEDQVLEATALAQSTQHFAGMVGIALSGGVLAIVYALAPNSFFPLATLFDSLTFFGSAALLLRLPSLMPRREAVQTEGLWHTLTVAAKLARDDLVEGAKVIAQDPFTRIGLPVYMVFQLSVSGFMVAYIVANSRWYGGGFGTLALIEFSFSATCLGFSIWIGRRRINRVAVAYVLGMFGTGVLVVLMGVMRPYPLFLLANLLCGVCLPFVWVPSAGYLQSAFPDEVRGRVGAAWNMAGTLSQPLGLALVGPLVQLVGPEGCFVIMGLGIVGAGSIGLLSRPFMASRLAAGAAV